MTFPGPNASRRLLKPVVVKLGGSLAESSRLPTVLKIVAAARVPTIVVPGGGAFADAVRRAQADFGFSDAVGHRMALLAMHQTGLMLAALEPRLVPTETLTGMRRILKARRIPVWLPMRMIAADTRVPANWTATSDAIAARLAERLSRALVVLVKSCRVPANATAAGLARARIVDATFAVIVRRARLDWRVLGAREDDALAMLLGVRTQTGHRPMHLPTAR